MLATISIMGFSLLFGIEFAVSNLIEKHRPLYIVFGSVFILVVFALNRRFHYVRANPRVQTVSGYERRASPLAHSEVTEYIKARAIELDVSTDLEVRNLEGTQNESANAEVFVDGRANVMALTDRMLVDFCSVQGSPERQRFEFIVDHELGHIAHRDTGLVMLAYAIFYSLLVFIPIKFIVIYILYPELNYYLLDFAQIFPAITAGEKLYTEFTPPSPTVLIGFNAALMLGGLGAIVALIYLMRLRREVLADQFAVGVAPNREQALSSLENALREQPSATGRAISFLGGLKTHPSSARRILRARKGDSATFEGVEVAISFIALLVLMRVLMGKATHVQLMSDTSPFIIAAVAYIIMFSFLVSVYLGGGGVSQLLSQAKRAVVLTVLGIFATVGMIVVDLSVRELAPKFEDAPAATVAALEVFEVQVLAWSFPACLLAFSISHVTVSFALHRILLRPTRLFTHVLCNLVIGIALVHLMSNFMTPVIKEHRKDVLTKIMSHYETVLHQRRDCWSVKRIRSDDCSEQFFALLVRKELPEQIDKEPFKPPIAWLYLWTQPFLRPGFVA